MARVDHAEVVARLKQELIAPAEHGRARQGIGIDKLLALLSRLEAECTYDEGLLERTLRRYGVVFSDDLTDRGDQSAPPERYGADGDDHGAAPSSRDREVAPKEESCPVAPQHLRPEARPRAMTTSLAAA